MQVEGTPSLGWGLVSCCSCLKILRGSGIRVLCAGIHVPCHRALKAQTSELSYQLLLEIQIYFPYKFVNATSACVIGSVGVRS